MCEYVPHVFWVPVTMDVPALFLIGGGRGGGGGYETDSHSRTSKTRL